MTDAVVISSISRWGGYHHATT